MKKSLFLIILLICISYTYAQKQNTRTNQLYDSLYDSISSSPITIVNGKSNYNLNGYYIIKFSLTEKITERKDTLFIFNAIFEAYGHSLDSLYCPQLTIETMKKHKMVFDGKISAFKHEKRDYYKTSYKNEVLYVNSTINGQNYHGSINYKIYDPDNGDYESIVSIPHCCVYSYVMTQEMYNTLMDEKIKKMSWKNMSLEKKNKPVMFGWKDGRICKRFNEFRGDIEQQRKLMDDIINKVK